ncbi:hypothetical protein GCM10027613_51500 [Microlunatus endophyticus]
MAISFAAFFLKLPKHHQQPKIDILGILTMAVATSALILATSWGGNKYDWDSWQILGLFGTALVIGAVFVIVEHFAAEPIIPLHLFKARNFNLTTIAALVMAIAMFGAIGYMPTYLQMSTGASATKSGLMLIPMVAGLLITSIVSGQIVSRTGRYKWAPLLSMVVAAAGVFLLSTLTVDTRTWVLLAYLFILGAGLGIGMQNLILIVQNTFPAREVGTATAANNFFRQIGATLGSAVVGSIFTSRLTDLLSERLPAQAMHGVSGSDTNSLTPALVKQLPQRIQDIIVGAYNDALTPIFLYLVPLLLAAFVLLLFIREQALATTIEGSGADLEIATTSGGERTARTGSPEHAINHAQVATPTRAASSNYSSTPVPVLNNADQNGMVVPTVNAPGEDDHTVNRTEQSPAEQNRPGSNGSQRDQDPAIRSTEWDAAQLDDPDERTSMAALDVLTAAQQQAKARHVAGRETTELVAARIDAIGHQLDAMIGGLHRQLQEVREQFLNQDHLKPAAMPDGSGADQLRQYEYNLLLDTQKTADRVTQLARAEAERILADAEQQRLDAAARVERLRKVERELTDSISSRLHNPEEGAAAS